MAIFFFSSVVVSLRLARNLKYPRKGHCTAVNGKGSDARYLVTYSGTYSTAGQSVSRPVGVESVEAQFCGDIYP